MRKKELAALPIQPAEGDGRLLAVRIDGDTLVIDGYNDGKYMGRYCMRKSGEYMSLVDGVWKQQKLEEREEQAEEIARLREEIEEMANIPPAPVATVMPDEETMRQIREEAAAEARAAADREMQAAVDAAVASALATVKEKQDKDKAKLKAAKEEAAEAKKQVENLKALRERDRAAAEERAAAYNERLDQLRSEMKAAESRATVAGNSAVQEFAIRFENLQREFEKLIGLADDIRREDADMADKSLGALEQILAQMRQECAAKMVGGDQ